jgi:uncharacterized protein
LKLQANKTDGSNAISRHSSQGVVVQGKSFTENVVVSWSQGVQPWSVSHFEALTEAHFTALGTLGPELILFGSGARMKFAPPALLKSLMAKNIGVECMDTPAACRTYNVLLAEGRSVVAALLFDPSH